MREFTVVIEQNEDRTYVTSLPELPGCQTQAETLDEVKHKNKRSN
ncbi:type II toxin-antitoxin system HicB family antitoxin [Methanosarcina sp.]|nr:type II toxin-antitoxin system HicB family antitoxin [Methanosarcina sp.]MDW5551653.1 type II toxin-antitoxin system HicB family antitoxin [Methanosarcina sp.]MDW5555538.1 type II toxin-antitoxin system HicB family antitoxin [Methanosarcina sp.]MDW5561112.1 type II toxin-antitoxin system HicB family antitoxin [Methanosarcina sp.]